MNLSRSSNLIGPLSSQKPWLPGRAAPLIGHGLPSSRTVARTKLGQEWGVLHSAHPRWES